MIPRGADGFGYDQANRLITAVVGGTTSGYAYDGDGKRALPVVLQDGTRKYIWGNGLAYAVDGAGNAEVYYVDGLGSVRAIANTSAEVVQTYRTDEFGVPIQAQGSSTQPFQYTGEQRDAESGLVYLRARMYDPAVGRFVSRDPMVKSGGGGQGWNRYAYASSNPTNRIDPSGLKSAQLRDPNPSCAALPGAYQGLCWAGSWALGYLLTALGLAALADVAQDDAPPPPIYYRVQNKTNTYATGKKIEASGSIWGKTPTLWGVSCPLCRRSEALCHRGREASNSQHPCRPIRAPAMGRLHTGPVRVPGSLWGSIRRTTVTSPYCSRSRYSRTQ